MNYQNLHKLQVLIIIGIAFLWKYYPIPQV